MARVPAPGPCRVQGRGARRSCAVVGGSSASVPVSGCPQASPVLAADSVAVAGEVGDDAAAADVQFAWCTHISLSSATKAAPVISVSSASVVAREEPEATEGVERQRRPHVARQLLAITASPTGSRSLAGSRATA